MKKLENYGLIELNNVEAMEIDGGGLFGAIVGGILGAIAGGVVGAVAGACAGSFIEDHWKE